MRDPALGDELRALATDDRQLAEKLAAEGRLYAGYHPDMAALHGRNAARLARILDEHGWPGTDLVGTDGEEAAWMIAQHAIGEPVFMRRALALLEAAVAAGQAPAWQAAFLDDRIRTFEGRPQRFGTQFDWDAEGELSPVLIDDPAEVDERRERLGLEPLAERTAGIRARSRAGSEQRPPDLDAWRQQMEAWMVAVGWRHPD